MSYNPRADLMQLLGKWTVTFSKFSVYKFWDFCSSVPEGSTVLGYGAASMDNPILTFWGQAKSLSSMFKMCSWAYQPLKMRTLCCSHIIHWCTITSQRNRKWSWVLPHIVFTDGAQFTHDGKGLPQQAEVTQGLPGRLRPWISWRFGTTRVVGRQPNAPAAFTPEEIPSTQFQRLSRPQGTWFCRRYHGKNPQWHHRESIPGPSN